MSRDLEVSNFVEEVENGLKKWNLVPEEYEKIKWDALALQMQWKLEIAKRQIKRETLIKLNQLIEINEPVDETINKPSNSLIPEYKQDVSSDTPDNFNLWRSMDLTKKYWYQKPPIARTIRWEKNGVQFVRQIPALDISQKVEKRKTTEKITIEWSQYSISPVLKNKELLDWFNFKSLSSEFMEDTKGLSLK